MIANRQIETIEVDILVETPLNIHRKNFSISWLSLKESSSLTTQLRQRMCLSGKTDVEDGRI